MKKIFITIFILLTINIFSQDPQTHFILEDEIPSNVTKDYIGRDFVQMAIGFHSKPDVLNHHVLAKTDPLLVFLPDDGEETGGSSNNNAGGVVGTLSGNLMVSSSGAAVYNIPINLPPGVNSITPSLGLVYNSQGGNGLLGIGWSLSGLSAITRTRTSLYHENFIDGVDFDGNDKLALDGQRLIPINSGEEYRTEVESFSKIVPHGNFAGYAEWYEVFTKDGRIIEYGNTNDSRIETSDGNHVLMWMINRIKDRKGNFIEFKYTEENGVGRIAKINYTGNTMTNLETFYEVEFVYRPSRTDPIKKFISGKVLEINNLLECINVEYKNTTLYSYQLNYENDFYSHLLNVTLKSANEDHFNPTVAQWGDDGEHIKDRLIIPKETASENRYVDQFFMDINGDGLSDVIRIEYSIYNSGDHTANKMENWYFRLMQDDGNFSEKKYFNVSPSTFKFYRTLKVGDYNGDGLQDFLILDFTHENKERTVVNSMFISQGESFNFYHFNKIEWWTFNKPEFRVGDFDGDGISELLIAYKKIPENYDSDPNNDMDDVYIWKFHETAPYFEYAFQAQMGFGNTGFDGSVLMVGDFNGDGCGDILRTAEYGASPGGSSTSNCFIYGVDFSTPELVWIYDSGYPTVWHRIYSGDFNADGITDLLTNNYTASEPIWEVSCFNGSDAFVGMNTPFLYSFDPGYPGADWANAIYLADFNGDSKTDIMELSMIEDIVPTASYRLFYSNGNNFEENSTGLINDLDGFITIDLQQGNVFPFNDFNGDNNADIYTTGTLNHDYIHMFDVNNDYNLVKKFINGFGLETTVTYKPLTDNSIYERGSMMSYPINIIQPALQVVSNINKDNAIGSVFETNYTYKGARIHKQGKGFLGFKKTIVTSNPGSGKSTRLENTYDINLNYYFPFIQESRYFTDIEGGGNQHVKLIENASPKVKDFGNKRVFYYNWNSYITDYHTGDEDGGYIRSVNKKQVFNEGNDINYGNVSKISINTLGDINWDDYTTVTDYFYNYEADAINNWIINRVESATTTIKSEDDPTSSTDTREITFEYYEDYPSFVEFKTHTPNGKQEMRTIDSFEYDDYGNITKTTLSAPGFVPAPPDRVTSFTYSPIYQYRFVTQTNKIVGSNELLTTTTYYPKTGLVESESDINNHIINYFYDSFGRLNKSVLPGGLITMQAMHWSINLSENPTNGLYRLWTQSSGNNESFTYFDQLGRELQEVAEDFNDTKVYIDKEYNSLGQLERMSLPHYSNEGKQWTNYTYLATGKVKTVIGSNTDITYMYNGFITKTTNNKTGITTSTENNPIGNTIKATDPGGTIEYDYLSSGQLYTASIDGNTTTLLYDEAGFQKSLDDPNAGTTAYTYNPFGELITQTNANLHTYKIVYDVLGRIESKTLVGSIDDIVNYTYFPQGTNGFGQLQKISASNGIEISYDYDDDSRVSTKTKTIDGQEYVYNYEYNIFGEAKKIIWPSGFAVNYHYKNGYLSAVEQTGTGTMLWQLNDINAQGQITKYKLGNGLLTTKGFDAHGFPTSIFTEGSIQNHMYEFNTNTGNLNWRSSVIYPPHGSHTLTEDFTYDDTEFNNRLETWKVNIGQLYSTSYYNNGNIQTKSDVGTFVYKGIEEGPHAVSLIEDPTTVYLENAKINEQHVIYTAFDKTKTIWNENPDSLNNKETLEIAYGPNQSRCKKEMFENGEKIKTKYFIDGLMEIEADANNSTRKLHYISAGDGLFAIYVIVDEEDNGSMYYIHKDYLGSIETITNEDAEVVERLSFDPWGRRRNVTNWSYDNVPISFTFDRGYTGHEHISEFDVINMNGRVYDPMLGRFLSTDNFVQAPYHTQSFNRYSYVMNNPLKFTDPSGEYAMLGAMGIFMFGSVVDHLVSPGDYNDKNIGDAIVNGAKDGLHAYDEINSVTSVSVYQDNNWNVSVGLSMTGLGINAGVSYTNGDWTLGANIGSGFTVNPETNIVGWESSYGGGATYRYFSAYANHFGGSHNQFVGGLGFDNGDFSIRIENDILAFGGEDRWRTSAVEIGIGNFIIGTNTYTNDPGNNIPEGDRDRGVDLNGRNMRGKFNRIPKKKERYGAWKYGQVYSSPLYLGYRNGSSITRIGVSNPWVQDRTQNFVHKNLFFGHQNFYNKYNYFNYDITSYGGFYNPYTLY